MTRSNRRPRAPAPKPVKVKPSWRLATEETEQSVDADAFLARYLDLLLSQHPTTNHGADHHD